MSNGDRIINGLKEALAIAKGEDQPAAVHVVKVSPTPGSDQAIAQGCTCPVIDNHHGAGIIHDGEDEPMFWYASRCPIHGSGEADFVVKLEEG